MAMKFPPLGAQGGQVTGENFAEAPDVGSFESEAFAPTRSARLGSSARRTIALRSDHVDVCGSVIVRIDDHPQAIEPKDNRMSIT
jgi:hypothetical protein